MGSYVHNNNGAILTGVKVVSIDVKNNARVLKAPLETGFTSLDDKVIDPKTVIVTAYVDKLKENFTPTMTYLKEMHANRKAKFCKVTNDGIVIDNLILETFTHQNDAEKPDLLRIELTYSEAMLIQEKSKTPSSPGYSATSSTGRVS